MDTLEYNRIIGNLDAQLEVAKKEAAERQRREGVEHELKLVDHWMVGLSKRKADLEKYGTPPQVDIDAHLADLRAQKVELEKQLKAFDDDPTQSAAASSIAAPVGPTTLSDADVEALDSLMADIAAGATPEDLTHAWTIVEIWALRWRVVVDPYSEDVQTQGVVRKAYAHIREQMDKQPKKGWFLHPLDKTKSCNWEAALVGAQERLSKIEYDIAMKGDALVTLEEARQEYEDNPDKETEKRFRHAVREASKWEDNRKHVARAVRPQRPLLEKEFGFLWGRGKAPKDALAPKKRMSNRDILSRLLRRMKSKALIGACHGPAEAMWNGFPEHAQDRAKEALDALVSGGIVRSKSGPGGDARVSIEPKFVKRAEAFIEGSGDLGVESVDRWYGTELAVKGC